MACGARDVLESARVHATLEEALAKKSLVVGTTRRRGSRRGLILPLSEAALQIVRTAGKNRVAVLFGNEHNGLSNSEIAACGLLVTIPSHPGCASLNLAQSVMLTAYELSQVGRQAPSPPLADDREVRDLLATIRQTLAVLGYGRRGNRDLGADITVNIRRLFGRAGLTDWELGMIRGLCRRVEDRVGSAAPGDAAAGKPRTPRRPKGSARASRSGPRRS